MALLEPGFAPAADPPLSVGRLRLPTNPVIEAAIDAALGAAELDLQEIDLVHWGAANEAGLTLLGVEAWAADRELALAGGLGADVELRLRRGGEASAQEVALAQAIAARWNSELNMLWSRIEVLALPTLLDLPAPIEHSESMMNIRATLPINVAGVPALALPVPTGGLPASLQLVGRPGSEERLVALGRRIEAAVGA